VNIWTYVITHDSGSAPNYDPPATTLAVCKPRIRKAAKEGDVILAFNGAPLNRFEPHSVRWAGVVAEVIPFARYWQDPRFQNKKPRHSITPDNIYEPTDDGSLRQVRNNVHGLTDAPKDIGGQNVLVFRKVWRFGRVIAVLPSSFALRMNGGRIGERKLQISSLRWRLLQRWLDTHVSKMAARSYPDWRCSSCADKHRPRKLRVY